MGSGDNQQAGLLHSDHAGFATTGFDGSTLQVDNCNATDEETGDTSLEVHQEAHLDAISIYSPSHYPKPSIYYGVEPPFDDQATLNSTRSLMSTEIDYVWENGRRYVGEYYIPNDDEELARQVLINQVYLSAFDRELTSVPLENPTHILDIGAGTGEWCISMAEVFPDCDVTGTDIADVFAKEIPRNVFPEYDNAEWPWERTPDTYDLVHFRNMAGAFRDWSFIYGEAFRVIKPGGWIEILDFDDHKGFRGFFSFFDDDSLLLKVLRDVEDAAVMSGRPRGVAHLEPRHLYAAGFEDVNITEHSIPISPKELSTGKLWLVAILTGLEPITLRLLTKYKGWTAEEVRMACAIMAEEVKALSLNRERVKGFAVKVRVVTGRKPDLPSDFETEPMDEDGAIPLDDAGSASLNQGGIVDNDDTRVQHSNDNNSDGNGSGKVLSQNS